MMPSGLYLPVYLVFEDEKSKGSDEKSVTQTPH